MTAPSQPLSSTLSIAATGAGGRPALGAHIASVTVNPHTSIGLLLRWGAGRIAGTVKVIDVPAPYRRVRLYDKITGDFVRETISDGSGLYAFENLLRGRTYYVTAEDSGSTPYNATIEDFVVPA